MSPLLGLSNDDVKTVGAGATTVGVLVALFFPPFRTWWRRPILSAEYDSARSEPNWDRISPTDDSFFLRLRVRNARNCDAAEDVQVIVTSYRAASLGLEGRALEWSGQRVWDGLPVTTIDVAPGLQRHVDLIQVAAALPVAREVDGEAGTDDTISAWLCVFPKPASGAQAVPRGDHRLVITLTAANSNPISYRTTIRFEGHLSTDLAAPLKRVRRRSVPETTRSGLKWAFRGFQTPDF